MPKKTPEQRQPEPFGLVPLPSSQPNAPYELTLPRLPAQPPRPLPKPCGDRPAGRQPRGCGGSRGLPRELPPGTAPWREVVVRKARSIHHHRIATKTKTVLPRAPAIETERSLQHPGSRWFPRKGGPQLRGWGAASARLLQGAGGKKKKTEPEERFLHGNGWSCWQISMRDNTGLGFPSLLPPGSSQPPSPSQSQLDAAWLPCLLLAKGCQLRDLQEHPNRLQRGNQHGQEPGWREGPVQAIGRSTRLSDAGSGTLLGKRTGRGDLQGLVTQDYLRPESHHPPRLEQ